MQRFWLWLYRFSAARLDKKPRCRPTIEELEDILTANEKVCIVVLPDGSIKAV
jgi:hypothetical protein